MNIYSMKGDSSISRAEQKEKRRAEILDAGLDLFLRKGFAATKIQDIADSVGMSVGLLFNYFESKEKLYEELVRIGVSGPQSVIPAAGSEPLEYFETMAKGLMYAIRSQPFTAKMFAFVNQAVRNEGASKAVRELLAQVDLITQCVPLIKAGQKNKTIREGDALALSIAFWSAITGIAEMIALVPDAPCPEAEWVVDILRRKS